MSEPDVYSWYGICRAILCPEPQKGRLFETSAYRFRAVTGTCTSIMKKKELEKRGFDVCLFDANEPELSILSTLKSYTHLLVSIPSVVGIGDPVLRHGDLLRSTLMDGNLQWLSYLSSTGVYGNCAGAWVDEDAVDTIIKQEPFSKFQKMRVSRQYTSRVHVEDICQALKASIYMPSISRIYNIVDDDPAPREEVFAYAEELIEKKWPTWVRRSTSSERAISCEKKGSSTGEKRVCNERMKTELAVTLLHPSYRSGLLSIIDQMENPFQSSPFQS
ncbi:hypothetical protein GH714_015661 [Hevea brasiliensis]|uniref:NAD(P)-binding domain-containing protein n=1 Tax=Hevea brasiliensis TaxID=3981 RepID=A0A6A6NHI6_HEVBR|nr:hypothetical protein GH714_015661 [Hevea brasiliensis]